VIWVLATCCVLLAAWVARLQLLMRRAAQPRKVIRLSDVPEDALDIQPVVVITGGDSFVVLDAHTMKRVFFDGVEAFRWDLAINPEKATARVCCWLDGAEIWKPVPQEV
jgi:hypothetical protein